MLSQWSQKHAPESLEEFAGNPLLREKLISASYVGFQNIILAGPAGSGKKTIIRLFLKKYFQTEENFQAGLLEVYGSIDRGLGMVSEHTERNNHEEKKKSYGNDDIVSFIKRKVKLDQSKMKVVIIYDFDSMRAEAQNALRRLMEKWSERVRFILVTSKLDGVLDAIQSRAIINQMIPLEWSEILPVLETIAQKEKLGKLNQDMLELIKLTADGDLRLAINLLQTLSQLEGQINPSRYYQILGIPPVETIEQVLDDCYQRKLEPAMKKIRSLLSSGFEIHDLVGMLTKVLIELEDFPGKPEFIRILTKQTLLIQKSYSEVQLYRMINLWVSRSE